MEEILNKLTQTFGPSGYEKEIRSLIRQEVEPYADEIAVDAMGSLIVRKGTLKPGGKRIMIAAHMDEIGLMVSYIDEKGFAYFAPIGGVDPLNCVAGRVRFENGAEGVISIQEEEVNKAPTLPQLFVDLGATSRDDCPVKVGDVAVFIRPFLRLKNRWVSKALDNRIGCLIAIETLKQISESPNELYFVFSTQEEVGCRGAKTAAYRIDPEMGIAVDVTIAADTPFCGDQGPVLGAGPCIKGRDNLLVAHPAVVEAMRSAAEKNDIPYQVDVLRYAGTDAGSIQLTRSGVPSGAISVSCRYVHSPSEMVDIDDVKNAIRLLKAVVQGSITTF